MPAICILSPQKKDKDPLPVSFMKKLASAGIPIRVRKAKSPAPAAICSSGSGQTPLPGSSATVPGDSSQGARRYRRLPESDPEPPQKVSSTGRKLRRHPDTESEPAKLSGAGRRLRRLLDTDLDTPAVSSREDKVQTGCVPGSSHQSHRRWDIGHVYNFSHNTWLVQVTFYSAIKKWTRHKLWISYSFPAYCCHLIWF